MLVPTRAKGYIRQDGAEKHKGEPGAGGHKSEPEHFVEFAERIPEWCVVIGPIGSGQEIHVGEEAGLVQWRWAVERSGHPQSWTVHAPLAVEDVFGGTLVAFELEPALNLDTELRFHQASDLHRLVSGLLDAKPASAIRPLAEQLEADGFHLRLTRSLNGRRVTSESATPRIAMPASGSWHPPRTRT